MRGVVVQPADRFPGLRRVELANARWQLDELFATLQVEDKDARQDLLDVEPAGRTDARSGA